MRSTDFSIISNNCVGGYIYQHFGISYKSPTEGLYFTTDDYLKLVERPEHYFTHDVVLIDAQDSTLAKQGKNIDYPVGKIDDVEIYFMHYPNPQEALNVWRRRTSRINFQKLFFLLTETTTVNLEQIKEFGRLLNANANTIMKKGMCLTLSNYDIPHTTYVPNVPRNKANGFVYWEPEIVMKSIDWTKILNYL